MRELFLKSILTHGPFESYVLPISEFPIPAAELGDIDAFLQTLCASAMKRWKLSTEVFLQLEQLFGDGARESFADHGKAWLPETGLGVWVDREPPKKWTLEDFQSLMPGDKLRPIMFQVFRISTAQSVRMQARSTMLRHGSILEILTPEGDYLSKAKPIFMQGIVDRSYTCFPYYVGLIEGKTMASAKLEDLHRWFQGMTVYVRESSEDKGVLIAAAVPLGDIFKEMGGTREESGWVFPR